MLRIFLTLLTFLFLPFKTSLQENPDFAPQAAIPTPIIPKIKISAIIHGDMLVLVCW
ncbi:Uncharacterised protein, partial [Mycoplasma putrefaciens]